MREQVGCDRLVHEVRGIVPAVLADLAEDIEVEFRTDDGGESQCLRRSVAEIPDPAGDDRSDARRDRHMERCESAASVSRPSADRRRTASPTKSGLPLVARVTAVTT